MEKRYTSDPKQALRRNAFTNLNLKKTLLILIGFLLLGGKNAWAQTGYELTHSSGTKTYYVHTVETVANVNNNTTATGSQAYKFRVSESPTTPEGSEYDYIKRINVTGGSVTFVFLTSEPVGFAPATGADNSAFTVSAGTLKLELDLSYESDITLRRVGADNTFTNTNNSSVPFHLPNSNGAASAKKIIIEGLPPLADSLKYPESGVENDTATFLAGRQFVIDNAANISSVSLTDGQPTYTGKGVYLPIFRVETGTLHLTNVTLQNSYNSRDGGSNHNGVYIMTNNAAGGKNVDVKLTHCWLNKLISNSNSARAGYPGLGIQYSVKSENGRADVVVKRCKFSNLSSFNGEDSAIRSLSSCTAYVTIDSCTVCHNYGGGIRWQGLPAKQPLQILNSTIKGNYSILSGGGIMAKAPINLVGSKILNNKAHVNGGGINYMAFDEPGQSESSAGKLYPKNLTLTMDATTLIDGNEAETGDGGGLYVWGRLINLTANVTSGNNYIYYEYNDDGTVAGPYKMELNLNGATISNNKAYNNGGGIHIYRQGDASCYLIKCKLNYGTITGNKALHGNGGGLSISQTETPDPAHVNSDHPAQNIEVSTGGGANDLIISNDTASINGGGIYLYSINDGTGWNAYQKFNTLVTLDKKTFIQSDVASTGSGGGLYVEKGSVDIKESTIGGNNIALGNKANLYGGGIFVNSGSIKLLSSTIQHNVAQTHSGGGIFLETGDVLINPDENETTQPTKIDHNIANLNGGGLSNRNGKVVIFGSFDSGTTYPVEITNNQATTGSGGGIFCIGDGSTPEYDIRMRRVKIDGNMALNGGGSQSIPVVVSGCGGGIYLQDGKISIINGKLNENEAKVSGGGIYTHSGDIDINPTREERQASEITNNTANLNGGGLNTHNGKITVQGNNKDNRILISGNKATTGSGGGIFCMGGAGNTEYITMLHANLVNNKASNGGENAGTGVTAGCGGGIYLQQGKITATDVYIQNNYAKVNGGGINNHSGNIDIDGCLIGGTDYYSETTYDPAHPENTARGNKAGQNGGGIYTNLGDIDIEDYVETEGGINRYESRITYNEAAGNGGGINTHQGTISINDKQMDDQIEVSHNKANKGGGMYANAGTIMAYNALIHDNTATQNGGGINNHSGSITLYGGTLSNNTAELGHGGGAYTNVGDIDLLQFPSNKFNDLTLNDGTKVYNNIALKNGGAFNNHTGRVDVRHATLYNNTSTQGNGGAIFCEGPHANANRGLGFTIRLLSSDVVQNKTRGQDGTEADPTGRGGGIYLKYGSIYAHYSNILNNEANIAGGGLDNHSGNILLYGCDIIGNRALELDGGGIYTKKGHITTGPSTERVANPTRSKATVIQKNIAHYDGGGIYNEEGNFNLNGDIIGGATEDLGNTAQKGHGGGVYIAKGIINMKGGKIAYNSAAKGKGGGVYSGGGEFNIEKRDDNPLPIILIVDVEVERAGSGQQALVHYHRVDQGKYESVSNIKHGIVWWDKSVPGTPYTVEYSTTEGYTYNEGEPAYHSITIPTDKISDDKTYVVKAFYQYEYSSNTYIGESEEMEFITFSATLPTVASGSVSNITKTSAEGSGKIMDNGGSAISARGVQLWTGSSTPPADPAGTLHPSLETTDFFTVNLSLSPNTTYYARAYATNNSGNTGFGAVVEFKTPKDTPNMSGTLEIPAVTANSADFKYTMSTASLAGYGFIISTDDDPELHTDNTIAGINGGSYFSATASDLEEGTAYYVRAYATNELSPTDLSDYSLTAPVRFFTPYSDGKPVVRAIRISGITQTSALITCKIFSGYGGTTVYGVHLENGGGSYHPSTNYNAADSTYTVSLSGLSPNTTYYLKAYATNDDGATYSYGNGYNFTTLPISLPHVVIASISDIGKTSANINCEVNDGGGIITTYGVKWGTDNPPTQHDASYSSAPATNPFTIALPDGTNTMTEHTTYYVQAYATNSAGTHTCPVVSFTTDYDKPTVDNLAISNTATPDGTTPNATASFNVAADSSATADIVNTYGVCWSILHNPTRSTSVVSDSHFAETTGSPISSTTPQLCNQTMTQRFPNTKYYVRAYASTSSPSGSGELADIVYTDEESFITLPTIITVTASNIGPTSATLSGQIANRDSEGYLVNGYYGVCWGTSENPTITDDHTEREITAPNANTFDFSLDATTNISYGTSTTYHYRAYYKSSTGEVAYGEDKTFNPLQYGVTVSANPDEGGTVSASYNDNGTCTVTATANTGYSFTNWEESSSEVSTSASYTFAIGLTDHVLVANFTPNSYTVTVSANPPAGGTVTGGGSYDHGASCTVTATPNSGYTFSNWTDGSGNMVSEDASYTFTVTEAISLTANFDVSSKSSPSVPSTGTGTSGRPRDIYPAPAREPWDWDDEDDEIAFGKKNDFERISALQGITAMGDSTAIDSLIQLREQMERDVVAPTSIPSIDHNSAEYGGGIYMEYTDKTHVTEPTKLVFTGGANTDPVKGQINFNYASEAGGGIYISDSAYMQMKWHCEVNANRVPEGKRGGGIYLKGRLYVGNEKNDVAGTHGLIVNKNYAVNVSDADFATNYEAIVNGSAIADTTNKYKKNLNNVFLTRYESDFVNNWEDSKAGSADYDDLATVITLLSDISGKDGSGNPYSNIGFSVLRGFCPVIATSAYLWGPYVNTNTDPSLNPDYEGWLFNLMKSSKDGISGFDENGALFEDSETYVAIHTRTKSQPFLPKYIYLWGCWTYPAVKEDPENLKPMTGSSSPTNPASDSDWQGHYVITDPENDGILHWDIYSEEGLSWFSSYVNGLNVFKEGDGGVHLEYSADKNPYATATLMNDVDLRSHIWTPIGSVTSFQDSNLGGSSSLFNDDSSNPHHFKGSFDGQGHTIKGMNVRYVSGIHKYGLFGYLDEGATVKNVFIDDSEFITDDALESYSVGGIAGLVTPSSSKNIVISASEARVQINVSNAKKTTSYVGGLVGKVADGAAANNVTIHSSMAMPEITGAVDYMGGLVGQLGENNKLLNSFANAKFPQTTNPWYAMSTDKYIGGLVGENNGIVENCYSRLQGDEPTSNGTASVFGWLAGSNTVAASGSAEGGIRFSYIPSGQTVYVKSATSGYNEVPYGHGTYTATTRVSGKYGFKHRDQQMTAVSADDATYISVALNDTLIVGGLTNSLNAWVLANGSTTYHPWMRTMASTINDDLPIPQFKVWTSTTKAIVEDERYNAVGSKDGVYMDYNLDANTLLGEYVTTDPSTYSSPSVYLYDPNTLADGTTAEPIKVTNIGTTNPNVTFEIHEDVGITVADDASSVGLKARVGVTFDNSNRSTLPELGGKPYDWHMFGSAINGVSMGLVYHGDLGSGEYHVWDNYSDYYANGIPNDDYNGSIDTYNRVKMDPPKTQWYQSSNPSETTTYDAAKVGYFPTNTPYGTWRDVETAESVGGSFDFYAYGERYYQHWINFKRKGVASFYDHWRQDPTEDGHHLNIPYPNEERFINGKGYMMAVSERSMLMADGTLNNGPVNYTATYTTNPQATVYDEMVRGTNLIGNPFQSYLDFTEFASNNSGILTGGNTAVYYILDADSLGYISFTAGSSSNEFGATRYIHPHQGFFVRVNSEGSLSFTDGMRVAGKYKSPIDPANPLSNFRNEQVNYPLVNLLCFDAEGKRDYTTVEINRPDVGGGQKMKGLRLGDALLYARWDDVDYQTAFTPEGVREVPVRFEAIEDGIFTMKWNMLHGDFHYVHLIDNLAGADVDMLRATEYKFEGRTTDYASRFKLVFEVTGLEEPDDGDDPSAGSGSFAFQMGDELIVNGAGVLQMFDLTGRCLLSTQTAGDQSSVSLPRVAAGMYLLRLTGSQQNRIQKIIIK